MSPRWYLLAVLLVSAVGCGAVSATDHDQLLSLATWMAQPVVKPLLIQQANQKEQLDGLISQINCLTGLISYLNYRQTQLELTESDQNSTYSTLQPRLSKQDHRLDHLDKQTLLSALMGNKFINGIGSVDEAYANRPRDCSDLPPSRQSGIYYLYLGLDRPGPPVPAFCDMDTSGGGWTVFQRRTEIQPRTDFYRGWVQYKEGFGELDMEFWWGLEPLFRLTSLRDRRYELRIDLEDYEGEKRHAIYQNFRISSEKDGYRLLASNYSGGDAGDSLSQHFGMKFTTKDKDQDERRDNCAIISTGAWWYKNCYDSNLNGKSLSGTHGKDEYSISWKSWKGVDYFLKTVDMKFRPTLKSIN